jgi:hypothetical protein
MSRRWISGDGATRADSGWTRAGREDLSSSRESSSNGNWLSVWTRNFSAAVEVRREGLATGRWSSISKLLAVAQKQARWKQKIQKVRTDPFTSTRSKTSNRASFRAFSSRPVAVERLGTPHWNISFTHKSCYRPGNMARHSVGETQQLIHECCQMILNSTTRS